MLECMSSVELRSWNALESGVDETYASPLPGEPAANDDKYIGGVVAICAGSPVFPGAGVLCTTAATRTTSSMVRYIGDSSAAIAANPEVVGHQDVDSAGRVQAWVIGPGRGTDDSAAAELRTVLERDEPVVVDADALTLLAQRADLRDVVRTRGCTVLTPHAGECERLAEAESVEQHDRVETACQLARALNCTLLLKGRETIIAEGEHEHVIDAGSSGSGDVLAGIIGALIARPGQAGGLREATTAVLIHSVAAHLSARTEFGFAPTSASRIAEAIPAAMAKLGTTES